MNNSNKRIHIFFFILTLTSTVRLGKSEYASDKQKHIHHNPMFHLTIYKPLIQVGRLPTYLVKDIIGTSYDYTKDFIERYKEDGIIW